MTEEEFQALVIFVRAMAGLSAHAAKHGSASPYEEERIIDEARLTLVKGDT